MNIKKKSRIISTLSAITLIGMITPALAQETQRFLSAPKQSLETDEARPTQASPEILELIKDKLSASDAPQTPALDFSLSSMVLFALNESPDIEIAKETEKQAYHTINEARDGLYPKLTFSAEMGYGYANPAGGTTAKNSNINLSNEVALSLQQLIFDGFSTINTVNRRKSQRDAAEIEVDIAVQDTVTETVKNYIDIYKNQQKLASVKSFLDQINMITAKIALREEEGAASKVKLEYARSRLSSAKTQLTDIVSTLNDSISNLEFLVGKLPDFNATKPQELVLEDNTVQQFIDYGFINNSDIKLNQANLKAEEYNTASKKGAFAPKITWYADAKRNHDDGGEVGPTSELSTTVRMEYQLLGIRGRQASVAKAKSQANALILTEKKIQKTLRREIKQRYNQLSSIKQALVDTEDEINANLRLQKLNRENFEYGDIDIIELIEGEERLINARSRKYDLETDFYTNSYELLLLIGYLDKSYFCNSC